MASTSKFKSRMNNLKNDRTYYKAEKAECEGMCIPGTAYPKKLN